MGGEINSVIKKGKDLLNLCLIFPDVYEIGMSHLGMKILYERLNDSENIFAERFFMPWADAIDKLGSGIFISLETFKPLKDFDILGFSLQYELSYTNLLSTLILSQIPVKSKDRNEISPIIIAGGPCVFNPSPLKNFIDAFFIGEMEEGLVDVVKEFYKIKEKSRLEKLTFLDSFDFIYVPSINPLKKVKRKIHMSFSEDNTLNKPIVPLMPVVQDRVAIEISRGCSRGCRFCQAGMIYRPVREKNVGLIEKNALEQLNLTGYDEVSMLSLSASDYSKLETLLMNFAQIVEKKNVSLALPSIRADMMKDYIFEELSRIRKSGFTIAPEAGSQRMRNIINKNLTEEQIEKAVLMAAKNNWNGAKLYFMIGLPFETDEDVIEIAELAKRLLTKTKSVNKRFNITVSVSNFVPKPFTPFQWCGQDSQEELYRKQKLIKENLYRTKIKFKFHNVEMSVLEAVISKGDELVGDILLRAVEKGCRFDGWDEMFDFKIWQDVFKEFSIVPEDISCKYFSKNSLLPWDNIDVGIEGHFLFKEYEISKKEILTEDCRIDVCSGCGLCDFKEIKNIDADDKNLSDNLEETNIRNYFKYEMIFEKKGRGILLSSIEISKMFVHILKICGVTLEFSYGFNPQPKFSYLFALPVGMEGEHEIAYFSAAELDNSKVLINKMHNFLPEGIRVKKIRKRKNTKKVHVAKVFYKLGESEYDFLKKSLENDKAYYIKKNKKGVNKRISLKDFNPKIFENYFAMNISTQGGFNLLEFFKFWDYNISNLEISRTKIELLQGE
jgi:radical SAM family uncharacterized protein/radical SAM-linked protein